MFETTSPHSYPNDHSFKENSSSFYQKNPSDVRANQLFPIDESEEFHDPFSDLNLYLSSKVKLSIQKHGTPRKWSTKIQTDLMEKILPEFSLKFPRYRLGLSAIKKVWEKVMYYYEKIQMQHGATLEDGKLNLAFMIKENLKQYPLNKTSIHIHPYNYAYQLAVKLSECIATLDGIKPILDRLTKIIWASQKHLLPKASLSKRSPFEQYDHLDKLIVKTQLEISAKYTDLDQKQLALEIKNSIKRIKVLTQESGIEDIPSVISCLLAQKLFPTISLRQRLSSDDLSAFIRFIKRQFSLYPCPKSLPQAIYRREMVQRISQLYTILNEIPKNLSPEILKNAIHYVYSLFSSPSSNKCPPCDPTIFQFINAQISLLKEGMSRYTQDEIFEIIHHCYQLGKELPILGFHEKHDLELCIWYVQADIDSSLHLQGELKELILEEISHQFIEHPSMTFHKCVSSVTQFFKKIGQLELKLSEGETSSPLDFISSGEELEHKIQFWSTQNDLIFMFIHFEEETPLLKLIEKFWEEKKCDEEDIDHDAFVQDVTFLFLKSHPEFEPFYKQVLNRMRILYKFFWYHGLSSPSESSYDRFLKWHLAKNPRENLEEITQKYLPLIPFKSV